MADLDTLRPEVQKAMHGLRKCVLRCEVRASLDVGLAIIRAELLRLATIEADALIALDCEHDWQVEHKRAEKAEAELAALKKRIEDAPSTHVFVNAQGAVDCDFPAACMEWDDRNVRLLVEDDDV